VTCLVSGVSRFLGRIHWSGLGPLLFSAGGVVRSAPDLNASTAVVLLLSWWNAGPVCAACVSAAF
jgi:hypothetical protein